MSPRFARTRRIRLTVVTWTVAIFLILWTVVFWQMRSGNDPVLRSQRTPVTTTTTPDQQPSGSDDGYGDGDGYGGFDDGPQGYYPGDDGGAYADPQTQQGGTSPGPAVTGQS